MPELPEKEILNQLFEEKDKYEISTDQEPQIDKKVESLVEKIEKDINSKPINDSAGQPLISQVPTLGPSPLIVLPLTKQKYFSKVKKKVEDSLLWLKEWCGRLIKKFGEGISFAEEKENDSK